MRNALRAVLSLGFWVFLLTSSALMFPVALVLWAVTAPFDRRLVALHRFTCFWASLYTWLNPVWRVEIDGRERLDREATYVMVANHLSLLDILVLFRLFSHFKWVSKIENFRVPFIGWNMSLNRYIKLKRGDKKSIVTMLDACAKTLDAGNSVMMFPEGTRSQDGRMKAFKPGAFEIAQRSGKPILPIAIEGSGDALPKRGFVLQGRHRIRVHVLDPLPVTAFAAQSPEALAGEVRSIIAAALPGERLEERRSA